MVHLDNRPSQSFDSAVCHRRRFERLSEVWESEASEAGQIKSEPMALATGAGGVVKRRTEDAPTPSGFVSRIALPTQHRRRPWLAPSVHCLSCQGEAGEAPAEPNLHEITARQEPRPPVKLIFRAGSGCAMAKCWALLLLVLSCNFPPAVGQDNGSERPKDLAKAPGLPVDINQGFLDPELKIDEWITRFEVESREVYACRKQIADALQMQPGQAVADIGAGTGLYMPIMAQAVGASGKVYAVDISPKFVTHLRKKAREEKLEQVEVVLCLAENIQLRPNSVDRVFVCDTYHHFEYPQSTLKSIYDALRPDGKLVVIDFEKIPGKSRQWTLDHVRAGKDVFKREIERAGFKFEQEVAVEGFKENYLLRFVK